MDFKTGAKLSYNMIEGRHSGEAMTSLGNSINNIWLTHTAFRMIQVDQYLVGALILGDDNLTILMVPEDYDHTHLA